MEWTHFFVRNTLAILGGLLFGALIGISAGLVITVFSLLGQADLYGAFIIGAIGGGFGFMLAAPHGFSIITYFYKTYIEGDLNYPEPEILRPRNPEREQPPAPSNLLQKIDQLSQAPALEPLTEDQIRRFREIIIKENNGEYKKKLEKYENYINDSCGLSYESIPLLEDPITIQGIHPNNNQTWYKTYDKKMFREWVVIRGADVLEPTNKYRLEDPRNQIQFIPGLPNWIYEFISLVESTLSLERSLVESSPVSHVIQIDSEDRPVLSKKMAIATARQQFYKNLSHFSVPNPNIPPVDDEKQILLERKNNDSHIETIANLGYTTPRI